MEKGTPEDQVDFIAAKIRTFQPSTRNVPENDWLTPVTSTTVRMTIIHYVLRIKSKYISIERLLHPLLDLVGAVVRLVRSDEGLRLCLGQPQLHLGVVFLTKNF